MTNSMAPRDPDAIIAAWLEEGPNQLPETTRRAIAVDLRTTRQTRRVLDVPWRPNTMTPFARLAVAAAAIVIAVGGGMYLLSPRDEGVGRPPAATPSPNAPSASPSTPLAWVTFTSDRFGYRIEVPQGWTHSAPTDDLPDELYPGDESQLGDRWDTPVLRTPWLIVSVLNPAPAETTDEWLARNFTLLESFCDAGEPTDVVVDGEPGTRRTTLCPSSIAGDLVLFAHDGRVYGIETGGAPRDAETMAQILDHVVSSFRFVAGVPDASATTKAIDRSQEDGYAMTVPSTWNSRAFPEGLYFSPPAPITSGAMWVGQVNSGEPEAGYVINFGDAPGGSQYAISGQSVAELLASVDSAYFALYSAEGSGQRQVTIDGEPAWVTEHTLSGPPGLWIDAVVIHGDRAYNLTMGAPPESADELRATFDEVMASIRWTG